MFKVNNQGSRMTSMILSYGLSSSLWTYLIPCTSIFIADFEHVILAAII